MSKKISLCLICSILLSSFAFAAVNYPYPQRKLYGNGTISVVNSTIDNDLKNRFQQYLTSFYVTGQCNGGGDGGWGSQNGTCARIKFTDPSDNNQANYTVSEGIGYAMLMAVYFSDKTTSYQTHFDNLWKYYKRWTNGNGVMNWKIRGFDSVEGQNGATDAEFDVALALIMAHYQFGDQKYLDDAKKLIGIIWKKDMNSDGMHRPGDAWDNIKNPSYVAPAAFELFKDLCPSGECTSSNWTTALSVNYTFLRNNQNSTTGLPSGWATSGGQPTTCTNNCGNNTANYDMDGARAPWRWAKAKAWFGHADAETLLAKLASWVNGLQPGNIKGPIALNGTMGSDANAGYIGSLMCALTHKNTYQEKLNSFWSTMGTMLGDSYFNESLYILTGLLASGNMPNLKACASSSTSDKSKGCDKDMEKIGGGDGSGTRLDRLGEEEYISYAANWESWYAYTDKDADDGTSNKPNSSITNAEEDAFDVRADCAPMKSYKVVKNDGADGWVVKIDSYTLNQGSYKYDPFVAIGLGARNNGKPTSEGGYDLSSCTGFSYEYKGSAHKFKVQTTLFEEGSGEDHFKAIREPSTSAWTTATVPNSELAQPTWVSNANKKAFDAAKIYAFAWELVGDVREDGKPDGQVKTGISSMTGSLAIKNFRCLGNLTLPSNAAKTCDEDGNVVTNPVDPVEPPVPIKTKLAQGNNSMFFARSSLNLNLANSGVLQVFDLKGNRVLTVNLTSGPSAISLVNLPKGVYFAVAKSASWQQTLKILR